MPTTRLCAWILLGCAIVSRASSEDLSVNSDADMGRFIKDRWAVDHIDRVWIGDEATDASLKLLRWLTKVRALTISSSNISDAGFAALNDLHALKELELADVAITDTAFERIDVNRLETIRLDCPRLSRVAFLHLVPANLRSVALLSGAFDDDIVTRICAMPALSELTLWRGRVTAAVGPALVGATRLERVTIDSDACAAGIIDDLVRCPRLTRMNLYGIPVEDAQIAQFEPLTNLTELALIRSRLTNAGVTQVCARFPHLRYLYLGSDAIDDACVDEVLALRELAGALVTGAKVSQEARKRIAARFTKP